MRRTSSHPSNMNLALSLVLSLLVAASGLVAWSQNPPGNTIGVRTVNGGSPKVELAVTSTKEFPVRNEVVILKIGNKEFTQSRSPEDGSLHTLIFTLSLDQFNTLAEGSDIVVQYGKSGAGDKWHFGKFNKSLLNKK